MTSKGSPFERLDGVVTAFGEAVGKANLEGIEYGNPPVAQHSSAIHELRKPEPVAGFEPKIEPAVGFSSVWNGHEVIEGFLQRVALQKPFEEAEHHVKGGLVLISQLVAVCKQQSTGALEVAALISRQLLLHALANVVHGLCAEAHNVEAVDDDLRVGKEGSGHIPEAAVHVQDDVLYLMPVGEGTQIILYSFYSPLGQNIQNAVVQRICDDALKPFSTQIALELVEGDGLG